MPATAKSPKKPMLPKFGAVLVLPELVVSTRASRKAQQKAVDEGLEQALLDYWRTGYKDHFKSTARGMYGYRDRSSAYKAKKRARFHSITDHVKTGRNKNFQTVVRPKFAILSGSVGGEKRGGTGVGSKFGRTGQLKLKFAFPTNTTEVGGMRKDGKPRITARELAEELGRWAKQHELKAKNVFERYYAHKFNELLRASPRIHKRMAVDLSRGTVLK